jgi:hypothetical protein
MRHLHATRALRARRRHDRPFSGRVPVERLEPRVLLAAYYPAADAYVRDGTYAMTNYGADVELQTKNDSTSYRREAFLKFDVGQTGLSAGVANAKIRLYGSIAGAADAYVVDLHAVGNTSWIESALNWNSRPSMGATALASTTVQGATHQWYEWDVTAYVQQEFAAGRPVLAFGLKNPANNATYVRFNSEEATANKAELVVTPPSQSIVTTVDTLSVNEGGSNTFGVKLGASPGVSNVVVTVAKQSGGDADLTTPATTLTFTPGNWNVNQVVTVNAAEDADGAAGTASFLLSATGLESRTVTATEVDNDVASLAPSDDAYVWGGAGTTNYGQDPELRVKGPGSVSVTRESYLKFPLASVTGVGSAALRVYGRLSTATGTVTVNGHSSANITWTENAITWNNRPGSDTTVLDSNTVVSTFEQWYEFDVSGFVAAQKQAGATSVTLVLRGPGNSDPYAIFDSDESADPNTRPRLIITPPTTPPPPANNPPVANDASFNVAENSANGTVVGTYAAADPDAGQALAYAITAGNADGAFAIGAATGQITVADGTKLDFEAAPTRTLTVSATDNGSPALSDTGVVTISVTNVNEAPTNLGLSPRDIAENQPADTAVGTFTVTDPDGGPQTLSFALVDGASYPDNAAFTVSGATLRAAAPFDREAKSTYTIKARATDAGGLGVDGVFTITINDVNEPPTAIALSNSSIVENSAVGTTVGSLSASDPDVPPQTPAFSLVAGAVDNASFQIQEGVLKSNAVFDRETRATYTVRVHVNDGSGTGFTQDFTVSVTNVNEGPTGIVLSTSSIAENAAPNAVVGALSVSDPDAGDTFTFALVAGVGGEDNGAFTIIGNVLRANASFDFETKSSYAIRVRATDAGGAAIEQALAITVTDVNEGERQLNLSNDVVSDDSAIGHVVGTFSAANTDPNSTFTFTLVAGEGADGNGSFDVVGNELRVNAALDFLTAPELGIRVRATDQAGRFHERALVVYVTDPGTVSILLNDNFSFEYPPQADGASQAINPMVSGFGWLYPSGVEVLDPAAGQFPGSASHGENVLRIHSPGGANVTGHLEHLTGQSVTAGTTYTLTAKYQAMGQPSVKVGLWAGGTLLASRTPGATRDGYRTLVVTYTSPASSPPAGPLRVVIDGPVSGSDLLILDDVRLQKSPVAGRPVVSLETLTPDAYEAESTPGAVSLRRTGDTSAPLDVYVRTADGGATPNLDYIGLPSVWTIPAGQASATFHVVPFDDRQREPTEAVSLEIIEHPSYVASPARTAAVGIIDNDDGSVSDYPILAATGVASDTIRMMWSNPLTGVASWRVEGSASGLPGSWSDLATGLAADDREYDEIALVARSQRYYRVAAVLADGTRVYSNVARATSLPAGTTPPADDPNAVPPPVGTEPDPDPAPSDPPPVTAPADPGEPDPAPYVPPPAGTDPSPGQPPAPTDPDDPAAPTVPAAPSNLTATAWNSANGASVYASWRDNSTNESGFVVQYSITAEFAAPITRTTPANQRWHNLPGLSSGAAYYVRVKAYNDVGPSEWSATAVVVTPVYGLVVETISDTRIDLTWHPAGEGDAQLVVERRHWDNSARDPWEPVTEFREVTAVPATTGEYSDIGLIEGTRYEYRIRVRAAGMSAAMSWAGNVAAATKPAAPTGLTATISAVSGSPNFFRSNHNLTWADNSAHEEYYVLEYSQDGVDWSSGWGGLWWYWNGHHAYIKDSTGGTMYNSWSSYSPTTEPPQYRLRAVANGLTSEPSNKVTITKPAAPAENSTILPSVSEGGDRWGWGWGWGWGWYGGLFGGWANTGFSGREEETEPHEAFVYRSQGAHWGGDDVGYQTDDTATTVQFKASGNATHGQDYDAPLSVTVPAGEYRTPFEVSIIDDDEPEGSEVATHQIEGTGSYIVVPRWGWYRGWGNGHISITDNDWVDLDVDSNNLDGLSRATEDEDAIEDNGGLPGQLIAVADEGAAPWSGPSGGMTMHLAGGIDWSKAKVKFAFDETKVRLNYRGNSMEPGEVTTAGAGGLSGLFPGWWYDMGRYGTSLSVQALKVSESPGDIRIEVMADPDGDEGPRGFELTDAVRFTGVKIDLDADSDNTNGTGTPDRSPEEEEIEREAPGKYVVLNDDDDNEDGRPDLAESGAAVAGEDDLVPVVLDFTQLGPYREGLKYGLSVIEGPAKVKVWEDPGKATLFRVGEVLDLPASPQVTVWVEGVELSAYPGDVLLRKEVGRQAPGSETSLVATDEVRMTVLGVDLDVDSDNNGRIGAQAEDSVEDTKAGVLVVVNRDNDDNDNILDFADGFGKFGDAAPTAGESDFSPVRLRVPRLLGGTSAGAKIVFDYNAAPLSAADRAAIEKPGLDGETYTTHHYTVGDGLLRLWKSDGDELRGAANFIESGREYSFADLGLSETDLNLSLHLEAVNGSASHTRIAVRLVLAAGTMASDVVRVLPLDPLIGLDESEVEGYRVVRGDGSSVVGGSGKDILIGTAAGESFLGMDGDDIILGGRNERPAVTTIDDPDAFAGDTIDGGGGADLIFSWFGNNQITLDDADELSRVDGYGRTTSAGAAVGSGMVAAAAGGFSDGQQFSSEDIEAAYAWMYGVDDIWMRGFKELGGQVLALEADGRYFSDWTIDWKRRGGVFSSYTGYDVKIEYDIGGVLVAAATLREGIMSTAYHDSPRWTRFFTDAFVENFQDNAVYEAVDEAWATLRDRNFEYAVKVAETAATLYVNGMTLAAGPGGDIADVIITVQEFFAKPDPGALFSSLLGVLPFIPGNIGRTGGAAQAASADGGEQAMTMAAGPNRFQRARAAIVDATKRLFELDGDVLYSMKNPTLRRAVGLTLRADLIDGDAVAPLIRPMFNADRSKVSLLVGTAQETGGTHAATIERIGVGFAKGEAVAVKLSDGAAYTIPARAHSHGTLNRSWSTATGRTAVSDRQPDLIFVGEDGKIHAYEVMSLGDEDKVAELQQKLDEVMATLPQSIRGDALVLRQDPA